MAWRKCSATLGKCALPVMGSPGRIEADIGPIVANLGSTGLGVPSVQAVCALRIDVRVFVTLKIVLGCGDSGVAGCATWRRQPS